MRKLAYMYVLLAALLWGSTAAVGKIVLENLDGFQVFFYISLIATVFLFFLALFKGRLSEVKKYNIQDYWRFTYLGFLGVFVYNVLFYWGLKFSTAQEAFIVNYTWPIWVVVFAALFLKETITFRKTLGILLGFVGVVVVITSGSFSFSSENLFGNILALSAAIFYGLFSAMGKKHNYDRIVSMLFYYISGTIFVSIFTLAFSSVPVLNFSQILGILWLGIFTAGLAFVFWFLALKHGDTAEMSNMIFLTPFISLVYIYFLLSESILVSSIVGLLIIVAGILIQKR